MSFRRAIGILLALLFSGSLFAPVGVREADKPIDLREFDRMATSLSEPEGYFDSDNFISNEAGYLTILPTLERLASQGEAYLGVGPDQNYSYIATIHPVLAVLVDIRRQNAMEHLYFKALFQLSADRVEYLERLLGRPFRDKLERSASTGISDLLDLVSATPRKPDFARTKVEEALRVIKSWHLSLEDGDFSTIRYVANAFIEGGPELKFTSYNRPPRAHHPTFRQLLTETDLSGAQVSYLAQEERFRAVKRLHAANRIVPIVGDLAGDVALRRTAAELRRRDLKVACLYTSNVEFYLFGSQRWGAYVRNVAALPLARNAYIIRTYANMWRAHPAQLPGYYMTTVMQSIRSFLTNESAGRNETYWDLVTRDNVPD